MLLSKMAARLCPAEVSLKIRTESSVGQKGTRGGPNVSSVQQQRVKERVFGVLTNFMPDDCVSKFRC